MKQENRFLFAKLFAIAAAALVFGCAPPSPNTTTADRGAAFKTGSAALVSSAGFNNCAANNVTLKDNITETGWDFTGLGNYTICRSTSSATTFQVKGSTDASALCFYPMNQPASGAPQLVGNPQCYSVTGSPILPVFTGVTGTINYMAVVDANYTSAMSGCLSSSTPCPAHSEGFIQ